MPYLSVDNDNVAMILPCYSVDNDDLATYDNLLFQCMWTTIIMLAMHGNAL